jgi:hypothetical protein
MTVGAAKFGLFAAAGAGGATGAWVKLTEWLAPSSNGSAVVFADGGGQTQTTDTTASQDWSEYDILRVVGTGKSSYAGDIMALYIRSSPASGLVNASFNEWKVPYNLSYRVAAKNTSSGWHNWGALVGPSTQPNVTAYDYTAVDMWLLSLNSSEWKPYSVRSSSCVEGQSGLLHFSLTEGVIETTSPIRKIAMYSNWPHVEGSHYTLYGLTAKNGPY